MKISITDSIGFDSLLRKIMMPDVRSPRRGGGKRNAGRSKYVPKRGNVPGSIRRAKLRAAQ